MISNGKKSLIHVAKAKTGISEVEYRDILARVDVTTSKDLTDKTFAQVMKHFEKMGFKSRSKASRAIKGLPIEKKALMAKLEAILLDLGLPWSYVDAIAKSRFKVETAQWLEPEDLQALVQMMIIHQRRTKKKA